MRYSNFNRHENMDSETLTEIMSIIKELRFSDESNFNIENKLYGLFDGYLYHDLQILALEHLSTDLASRICRIYDICNRYPKLEPVEC
jgi:hypothetical protein